LEHLKSQVSKMNHADRNCTLSFDKISLCQGFHYECVQQYISGFEDVCHLGRTHKATRYLVFMVPGVRKEWEQVIAYYFTSKK
jgi:hypothetical protein